LLGLPSRGVDLSLGTLSLGLISVLVVLDLGFKIASLQPNCATLFFQWALFTVSCPDTIILTHYS